MYLPRQLASLLGTTLLLNLCCCGQAPPNQFHGRAQPSSLDSFFERSLALVNEVNRLLSTAENDENVVEYCIARLENLLIINSLKPYNIANKSNDGLNVELNEQSRKTVHRLAREHPHLPFQN